MSDSWIRIASFSSLPEAYIAKGVLDNYDIPAQLTNTVISSVYPMTDTWAPVELLVPAPLAGKAAALLQNHD